MGVIIIGQASESCKFGEQDGKDNNKYEQYIVSSLDA